MSVLEYFTELIAYTLHFTSKIEQTFIPYRNAVDKFNQLITDSRHRFEGDYPLINSWERSLFAICAWIDERILLSNWSDKDTWQQNPLQKQYFHTTKAGEKFYEVLDSFDAKSEADIIEVFNFCIRLGFQGKNFNEGSAVTILNAQLLAKAPELKHGEVIETKLFADAYNFGRPRGGNRFKERYSMASIFVLTAVLSFAGVALLATIYNLLLNGQVAEYFK